MEKFLRVLKNWWFAIVAFLFVLLDQGFEVISPLLVEIDISKDCIGWIKVAFALYGLYKLKKEMPTQNVEKLQNIVDQKAAEQIGGSTTPVKKDEK